MSFKHPTNVKIKPRIYNMLFFINMFQIFIVIQKIHSFDTKFQEKLRRQAGECWKSGVGNPSSSGGNGQKLSSGSNIKMGQTSSRSNMKIGQKSSGSNIKMGQTSSGSNIKMPQSSPGSNIKIGTSSSSTSNAQPSRGRRKRAAKAESVAGK